MTRQKAEDKKTIDWRVVIGIAFLGSLLLLDILNIGDVVPAFARVNYQLWNIVAIVVIFIIGFLYVDKRDLKRKNAQEENCKLLIRNSYANCKMMIEYLNRTDFKKVLLSDFDGNAPYHTQRRFVGVHDLPFEDDQDIKKLAYEGVIESDVFDQYIRIKTLYQNIVTMYFVAPDHPEIYEDQKKKLLDLIPKDITLNGGTHNEILQNR